MSESDRDTMISNLTKVFEELREISSRLKPKSQDNSATKDNEDYFIERLIDIMGENLELGIEALKHISRGALIRFYSNVKDFVTKFSDYLPSEMNTKKLMVSVSDEKETETWTARGSGTTIGVDVRYNKTGFTKIVGRERVIFTNGQDRNIEAVYTIHNSTSIGFSSSIGVLSGSEGIVTRKFYVTATDKQILESYEGAFIVIGVGAGPISGGYVGTLDTKGNINSSSWKGGTLSLGISLDSIGSFGATFPIYNIVGAGVDPAWQRGVDIFVEAYSKFKEKLDMIEAFPYGVPNPEQYGIPEEYGFEYKQRNGKVEKKPD